MRLSQALILTALVLSLAVPPAARADKDEAEDQNATGGILMDTVVITATRTETDAFDAPASITAMDDEEIQERQGTNIRDIIEDVPNVDFSGGYTPYFQVPTIRGLDDEQIIVKIDGARQGYKDSAGNAKSPILLDPILLKQVEVLRGPSSALHGGGGIGGVIAMRSKDASDFLDPDANLGGTLKSGYQTVDDQMYLAGLVYGRQDDFNLLAGVITRDFSHMRLSSTDPDNSIHEREGYSTTKYVKGSFAPDDQYLALSFLDYENYFHTLGGAWYRAKQNQVTVNYEADPGNGWLDLRATGQYTWRANESKTTIQSNTDDFDSWGGDLQNTFRFGVQDVFFHTLTMGGDYYHDHQEGTVDGANDPSRPQATGTDLGLFIQDEISLPLGFTLIPALRYTAYEREPEDSSLAEGQSESEISPKITAQWQPMDWLNLFVTYAESFRPPSLTEIYFAMDYGAFAKVVPNPDLKPETAKTWEYGLGLSFDSVLADNDPFRVKIVYFRETVKDLMEAALVDSSAFPWIYTTINVNKAERFGYEAELYYGFDRYSVTATYGKVMGINPETGARAGQSPQQIGVRLGCDIPEQDLRLNWKSMFVDKSRGYQPWNGSDDTVLSYQLHGASLAWTPQDLFGYDGLRVDLGVDNLFEEEYVTYRGGYEPGRNFKLAVTLAF